MVNLKLIKGSRQGWAIGVFPDQSGVGITIFLLYDNKIVEEETVRPVLTGVTDFKLGAKSADELFMETVNAKVDDMWSRCAEKEKEMSNIEDPKKMVTSSVWLRLTG